MATLPLVELPHLALAAAAIVALSGRAVSVDHADERVDVRTDVDSAHEVTVADDNGDVHIAER